MPLLIQTTGLEQYAPGGAARVKVLVIGGPGAGKTRWASYFPAPIYADCEGGLASVADRQVPYVNISSSQDMLDLLTFLKQECRQPVEQRKYQTVVIDTLDAFQRKVKNEWMEKEKKQVFTGWEAWGYLNSRMQLLMTRLLNLNMHVIVNVHYKDRTTKDDETGKETHELMLQLQGETADTAFNDFDLVGWMGTYWEPVDGERVQKRGLTFQPVPDKPFLKDRLHVTPKWLEVDFAPSDYTNLFERIASRLQDIKSGETIGEIPSAAPDQPISNFVVPPGAAGSGAMPASQPREVPLSQLDKPALIQRARALGITTTVDGAPIRANTVKSELLAAIEAQQHKDQEPAEAPAEPAESAPAAEPTAPENPASQPPPTGPGVANPGRTVVAEVPEVGKVDTATGEVLDEPEQEMAKATELVEQELGGAVVEDKVTPVPPSPEPVSEPVSEQAEKPAVVCEVCGTDLADENPDIVKLSYIRYRKRMCSADYQAAKSGR